MKQIKVAIVVGHNEKAQGAEAIAPLGMSEWALHKEVSDAMMARNDREDLLIRRFLRPAGKFYQAEIADTYSRVNEWKADYCVELHFNCAEGEAVGTEVLYSGTSASKPFASSMLRALVLAFGLPDRGLKVVPKGQRGSGSIWAAKCPCVITEAFFGDSRADVSAYMRLGVSGYADALLAGIPSFI